MALLGLQNISYTLGGNNLFNKINLQIEKGDRLCLLGRNGVGKSTLLRLMAGTVIADSGEISRQSHLHLSFLEQEVPPAKEGSVLQILMENNSVELEQQAEVLLSQLNLDPQSSFSTLSGGNKRRVHLARTLLQAPDLLLLDEPTNHLDIQTITWMEEQLVMRNQTTVFITHDKAFARRLSNRIAELDRGKLYAFQSTYDQFVERREELLQAEETRMALFEKRLAQEEAWLRKGVKARLTRNEGRVKALKKMRLEYQNRRERLGKAQMNLDSGSRSGDLVFTSHDLGFAWTDHTLFQHLDLNIQRGDKLGIIGPNGAGKTTLIKLLLGDLKPTQGEIRQGTNLQILYFDQLRSQLELDKSVWENVGEGYDTVQVAGKSQHVLGYLEKFLFTPERSRAPVSILSGGERNRLLLAKLFTKPANLMVLDEPTNDLDAETMDLLEDLLVEFTGTLILVSHDRDFLDNVVTSTLYLEGDGKIWETIGGYSDWVKRKQQINKDAAKAESDKKDSKDISRESSDAKTVKVKKLNFKDQKELEALPDLISNLEAEQAKINDQMSQPEFYKNSGTQVSSLTARLAEIDTDLTLKYKRWEELESLK